MGVDRLRRLFADCGARVVVTTQKLKLALQATHAAGHRLPEGITQWVACKASQRCEGAMLAGVDVEDGDRNVEDTAFIQYTSGSTGNPKGVCVTYRALAWDLRAIKAVMVSNDILPGSTCVSCACAPDVPHTYSAYAV